MTHTSPYSKNAIPKNKIIKFLILFLSAMFLLTLVSRTVSASRVDELRQKISDNNAQIAEIQNEIEELQKQLNKTGADVKTLKNQISQFEATIKKLQTDVKLTEKKIISANFVLEELDIAIQLKENEINESKAALAEIIRNVNETESQSLVEVLLAQSSLSAFFGDLEQMNNLQDGISSNLAQLKALKEDFENQEAEKEKEKRGLEDLRSKLKDQKALVETQKKQKNTLLKETRNKESLYKNELAEQLAKQEALEKEISAIEEQIRVEIDPNSLPKTGSGVLIWPVESRVITQYFGNTPFATQNPQVYGGKGHNGIDIRASIGIPVKASMAGVVLDTGDTDKYCRGVSYGKWVLIKHENNLATLYAHLSLIKASPGQTIETGQVIGYSGDTGFVTGPHLHFTVFAAPAVKIGSLKSKICGTTMELPIAPYNGYLNPLSYL